jgi:hypothetical protein
MVAFAVFVLVSSGSRSELLGGAGGAPGNDETLADAGGPSDTDALSEIDGGPIACVPGTFALVQAVPAIMLVLDRSGSMNDVFSEGETRWEVLRSALSSTLPPVNSSMEIGALLFPSASSGSGGSSCTVAGTASLTPATEHVPALIALLQATSPGGETPTFDALGVAAGLLLDLRAATTARAIVLATDGAPNCNASLDPQTCTCSSTGQTCRSADQCLDNVRTVQSIATYEAQGLPTYVIGIQSTADTEFTEVLNAMALAGGRPQMGAATSYYAASSELDLDSALVAIRDQVGACTFLTTSVPSGEGSITVTIGGVVVPYDPSGKTGWSWGDESNGQIVLAGTTCTAFAANASAAITAQVGCNSADASADAE